MPGQNTLISKDEDDIATPCLRFGQDRRLSTADGHQLAHRFATTGLPDSDSPLLAESGSCQSTSALESCVKLYCFVSNFIVSCPGLLFVHNKLSTSSSSLSSNGEIRTIRNRTGGGGLHVVGGQVLGRCLLPSVLMPFGLDFVSNFIIARNSVTFVYDALVSNYIISKSISFFS